LFPRDVITGGQLTRDCIVSTPLLLFYFLLALFIAQEYHPPGGHFCDSAVLPGWIGILP